MAQFGFNKSFYSTSYYGVYGIASGQYDSDIIPIRQTMGATAQINIILQTKMPFATYYANDTNGLFVLDSNWNLYETSKQSSSVNAKCTVNITGTELVLSYGNKKSGITYGNAIVKLYSFDKDGVSTLLQTETVDLSTTSISDYKSLTSEFKNYQIVITPDSTNASGSFIQVDNIVTRVCDIKLEFFHKENQNDEFTEVLTPLHDFVYEDDKVEATLNIGPISAPKIKYYRFRIYMATADNDYSPEILSLNITSGELDKYSQTGLIKQTFDLGNDFDSNVDSIDSITYEADDTDCKIEIHSRTTSDTNVETDTDDLVNWGYWTIPYKKEIETGKGRLCIDLQNTNLKQIFLKNTTELSKLENGYIIGTLITPVYTPDWLDKWKEFIPDVVINDTDPYTFKKYNYNTLKRSYIVFSFLDAKLNQIIVNKDPMIYTYYLNENRETQLKDLAKMMEKIRIPLRVKMKFYVTPGYGTSCIDHIQITNYSYYKEVKHFTEHTGDQAAVTLNTTDNFDARVSNVYNKLSGEDDLYVDGVTRKQVADLTRIGFTLPDNIYHATYTILPPSSPKLTRGVTLRWSDSNKLVTKHEELHNDVKIICKTIVNKELPRHTYRYSGVTLALKENGKASVIPITYAFYPRLDTDKVYAFYLKNGFDTEASVNDNVDIRFNTENALQIYNNTGETFNYRRNIAYDMYAKVFVSIITAKKGTTAAWVSEDVVKEFIVNNGSPIINPDDDIETITLKIPRNELPEIPIDVIVNDNPYSISIVPNSVYSEDIVKKDNSVKLNILNIEYDNKPSIAYDAEMTKGEFIKDPIFTPKLISILAINTQPGTYLNDHTVEYQQNVHFTIEDGYINWTKASLLDDLPEKGTKLYVTYKYYDIKNLVIQYWCNEKKKYYDRLNVYRTNAKIYDGKCTLKSKYVSKKYSIDQLWPEIPKSIDKDTLTLKCSILDNPNVKAYVENNSVIVTTDGVDIQNNWHPYINKGRYFIGHNKYYLYTDKEDIFVGDSYIPVTKNMVHTNIDDYSGILIQQGTKNLLKNSNFDTINDVDTIISDDFTRS